MLLHHEEADLAGDKNIKAASGSLQTAQISSSLQVPQGGHQDFLCSKNVCCSNLVLELQVTNTSQSSLLG